MLLLIQLWNDSFQRGISSYHTAVNYSDLLRSSCLDPYERYLRCGPYDNFYSVGSAGENDHYPQWPSLAETHGIGAVKPVSKSMFTKITKLDSQMGKLSYSVNVINTKNRFFRWPDKMHKLRFEPRNHWTVSN